jgi:hypothetical protein
MVLLLAVGVVPASIGEDEQARSAFARGGKRLPIPVADIRPAVFSV